MDHTTTSPRSSTVPIAPRLLRSRSGTPAHETRATLSTSSQRYTNRSKSTTKSRTLSRGEENVNNKSPMLNIPSPITPPKKPPGNNRNNNGQTNGFVKFLQRNTLHSGSAHRTKSVPASPSAWALSPGRSSSIAEPPVFGGGGGVGGVLKYFRQKKVSPIQEEESHKFRMLHNRLVQWRFVNARAEVAMATVKRKAEERLFRVWLNTAKMRYSVMERRVQAQKKRQNIKAYQIIVPQIQFLHQWERLERKNSEGVSRVARKLCALSLVLPMQNAKADVEDVAQAMRMLADVVDNIIGANSKFFSRAEKMHDIQKELLITLERQKVCIEQLKKILPLIYTSLTNGLQSLARFTLHIKKEVHSSREMNL